MFRFFQYDCYQDTSFEQISSIHYARLIRHLTSAIFYQSLLTMGILPAFANDNVGNNEATLVLSTDNTEEVYFNGALLNTSNDRRQLNKHTVTLKPGMNVLAFKGVDSGNAAALIADIVWDDNLVISKGSWKISTIEQAGWQDLGFDDSHWAAASTYDLYGVAPWDEGIADFPNNSSIEWIWPTNNNIDKTVYLRYMLIIDSVSVGKQVGPISVTTDVDVPIDIDIGANAESEITIIKNPLNGNASVQADNNINYKPKEAYVGQDSITYKMTDPDGAVTIANLTIKVGCTSCLADAEITLRWNPDSTAVIGYRIYYGTTPNTATELLADLNIPKNEIDPEAPSVTYNAGKDLGLSVGDIVCFRIEAYNSGGSSNATKSLCTDIKG